MPANSDITRNMATGKTLCFLLGCLLLAGTYAQHTLERVESASSALCPDPGSFEGKDDEHIACQVETGSFSQGLPPNRREVNVMTYNIDRNGEGGDGPREAGLGPIIDLLKNVPVKPDVILLTEVRRCNGESGAAKIAEALNMNFAYGVEFVETGSTQWPNNECSIGNAVLSSFPIENPSEVRYERQCCRYGGRIGGRQGTYAEVVLGSNTRLFAVAAHLESGQGSVSSQAEALVVRTSQGNQSGMFANEKMASSPDQVKLAVVGGDFNAPLPMDGPVSALNLEGFTDILGKQYWWWQRDTCPDNPTGLKNLDYLMVKGYTDYANIEICNRPECIGWSDHVPVWATLKYP